MAPLVLCVNEKASCGADPDHTSLFLCPQTRTKLSYTTYISCLSWYERGSEWLTYTTILLYLDCSVMSHKQKSYK